MAPPKKKQRTPPKRTPGAPTGLAETLEWLKNMDEAGRAGELEMISTMTGKDAKARLDELGVDYEGHKETGVLRQIVAHTLDLGILPERCWTPRSVRYTANEMLRVPASEEDVGKGAKAKVYLRGLLKKDDVDPVRNLEDDFSMVGMGDDFRKKMAKMIDDEKVRVAKEAEKEPETVP